MSKLIIITSHNVKIEYQLAGIGDRIIAYLIDVLIIIGIAIIVFFIGDLLRQFLNSYFLSKILQFMFFIPIFFYDLICELSMNGQSYGKKIRKIRVLKADGREGNFTAYFLRQLLKPIDSIYFLGFAVIFLTKYNQRIGDLAAGTILVRTKKNMDIEDIDSVYVPKYYEPLYIEAQHLKEKEAVLIDKVLSERKNKPNHQNVLLLSEKIKSIHNIKSDETDFNFLKHLLDDYHHYVNKD